MKKIVATLIAGLFASAAFAQTTTATGNTATAAPTKAEVKADAKDAKAAAKADTKEAKAAAKTDAKEAKTPGKSSVRPPAEVSTTTQANTQTDTHTGKHADTHGADVSATAKTK